MSKLIVFDMDGVIFEHSNFWIELHKAYRTYEEGIELTRKYLKTDYKKLVEEVVGRLWKGKDAKSYFNLIKKIKYLPNVEETIRELKKLNYKIAIISAGPKHLAERVKKELKIDYIYSNNLLIRNGKIVGSKNIKHWPIRYGNKGEILRELCRKHNIDLKDVIVVCNSNNDIKMARPAGLAICLKPEEEEIKKYCNVIINKGTLKDVLRFVDEFEKRESIFNHIQ